MASTLVLGGREVLATIEDQKEGFFVSRLAKEIYLSVFVVFFRAVALFNTPYGCAQTGVAAIAYAQWILGLCLFDWMQIMTSRLFDLPTWAAVVILLALYVVNHFFLINRRNGVDFEQQFNSFSMHKRITLRLAALGLFSVIQLFFVVSVSAYHQSFNLIGNGASAN